jgi:hypothetical protein
MRTKLVAIGALAAGAVLALAAPAAAQNGDVKVTIGLGSSVTAGRTTSLNVTTSNTTNQVFLTVRRVIVIQLPGLTENQVTLTASHDGLTSLSRSMGSDGSIRFEDRLPFRLASEQKGSSDTRTTNFTLKFDTGAPSGDATVTVYAFNGNAQLGSASDQISVRGGTGQTTTTPPATTPPATESASPDAAGPGAGAEQTEGPLLSGAAGGIPTILYILGAVLLAIGGGILWLLFRRPAEESATGAYPTVPSAGRHSHRPDPTTVMPTVRDPHTPPPGVDPWAPVDPTREFPRHPPR